MAYSKQELWLRFQQCHSEFPELGLSLGVSRVNFPDDVFTSMAPRIRKAFTDMEALEKGAIADPDDRIDNTLSCMSSELGQTLCVVVDACQDELGQRPRIN